MGVEGWTFAEGYSDLNRGLYTMLSVFKRWRDIGYKNIYGTETIQRWCGRFTREHRDTIRILDVGCGSGRDLLAVRDAVGQNRTVELYGIECTPELAENAKARKIQALNIDLECMSLPFPDNFFDIVMANQVLEHLKNWIWAFHEQVRVAKRGGVVIIGVPNLAALHNRILMLLGRQPSCIKADGPHVRGFTRHELHRLGRSVAGIEILQSTGTYVYGLPPRLGKRFARIFPSLSATILLALKKTSDQTDILSVMAEHARFETNYYLGA